MKSKFREDFEAFYKIFNEERSCIIPLLNIKNKAIEELREEGKRLIEKIAILTRIYYITQTKREFEIDELLFCFKNIQISSISQSLRLFQRPNHKDRYLYIIQFCTKNPTILAQIVYFYFCRYIENDINYTKKIDDQYFFCFSTFPSIFTYFITKNMQNNALKFVESLFQLHFFLQIPQFPFHHEFLYDITFSFFLQTNPACFFDSSILPIICNSWSFIEDRIFTYTNTLCRAPYWTQVIYFVKAVIERMKNLTSLLPQSAKLLISNLLNIAKDYESSCPNLKYQLIVNNLICRYMVSYVESPEVLLLRDSVTIIKSVCNLPVLLDNEAKSLVINTNIDIDDFINSLCSNTVIDDISEAVTLAECSSYLTTRDLKILYDMIAHFQKYIDKNDNTASNEEKKDKTINDELSRLLNGVSRPLKITEVDFISLNLNDLVPFNNQIKLLSLAPYEEIIDLFNSFDLSKVDYSTPEELQQAIFKFSSIYLTPQIQQKITKEALCQTSHVVENVTSNHRMLEELSNKLASSLYFILNEYQKYNKQYTFMISIIANKFMIPQLIEKHPNDFLYNHKDIFSPRDSYDRLIAAVTSRINSLNISDENANKLKKTFFYEFIDQIDNAFSFQLKVKNVQTSQLLSNYVHINSTFFSKLPMQKQKQINKSAMKFQYIKKTHKISFNLITALQAASIVSIFPDEALLLAISLSGNNDIFNFIYFVNSYFQDQRIADVILAKDEQNLLSKIQKGCQFLKDGKFTPITSF